jgi:hypothetical protein
MNFFTRDDVDLLREASPLTRSGNQHRFYSSLRLEYGLTLAVFDPQVERERESPRIHLSIAEAVLVPT